MIIEWRKYRRKMGFGAPGAACCSSQKENQKREMEARHAFEAGWEAAVKDVIETGSNAYHEADRPGMRALTLLKFLEENYFDKRELALPDPEKEAK